MSNKTTTPQELLVKGLIKQFNLNGEIRAHITPHYFAAGDSITNKRDLLGPNPYRVGFMIYNKSDNSIYVAFSSNIASGTNFTYEIGAHSSWTYQPTTGVYQGAVTFNPSVSGDGRVMVTELVLEVDRRTL